MSGNYALVFGASGITGWAIVNQIISHGYPEAASFESVTALTNRPLSLEAAQWPNSSKLNVVSGIDILNPNGQRALEDELESRVKHIRAITHVYFFAYIMDPDPEKESSINKDLLSKAVRAIDALSPSLKTVVLPTGTKAYGIHLLEKFPFSDQLPLKEDLPRIPEPYASQMFYYPQCDELVALSKGKQWTWCDVVPDIIIGFVPNNNVYSLAQWLGLYLSLRKELDGEGSEVQFPGTTRSWKALVSDSSQDLVARISIIASLNPEKTGGERYNAADTAEASSWSRKWPVICAYFGLKGVGPPSEGAGPDPAQYLNDHVQDWNKIEKTHGLVTGRVANDRSLVGFPVFAIRMFDFDHQVDMSKTHEMMGSRVEEVEIAKAWYTAFDRYRKAKIFP